MIEVLYNSTVHRCTCIDVQYTVVHVNKIEYRAGCSRTSKEIRQLHKCFQ